MNDTQDEGQRAGERSPWERPRLTLLGAISEIVRSANKPSGGGDEDLGGRKPTGM